jgi:hypothetical protein
VVALEGSDQDEGPEYSNDIRLTKGGNVSRKPTLVGSRTFALKKDAEDACRQILYKYQLGERVASPEDERFLLDLLDLHTDREGKLGSGVDHFEVRSNPKFIKQRSFYLVRTDGSETDFSFLKCLRPPTQRQVVMAAMRQEVAMQIFDFAETAYAAGPEVACAVTGVAVLRSMAHVDHSSPTFVELAEDFVAQHGGWDEFEVARADGSIGVQLGNPDQARAWRDYHRKNSNLQIVSVQANLSLLRLGVKRRK